MKDVLRCRERRVGRVVLLQRVIEVGIQGCLGRHVRGCSTCRGGESTDERHVRMSRGKHILMKVGSDAPVRVRKEGWGATRTLGSRRAWGPVQTPLGDPAVASQAGEKACQHLGLGTGLGNRDIQQRNLPNLSKQS